MSGSRHIEFLLDKKLIKAKSSKILDELYASGKRPFDTVSSSSGSDAEESRIGTMVLHKSDGKRIAEALEMSELDVELDRAVWQVEKALKAEQELKQEMADLKEANAKSNEKK